MTTTTAACLTDWATADDTPTPNLAMYGTYYGISVSDIGEDGDLIALGHVGKYRALAAFMAYCREIGSDLIWYGSRTLPRALDSVEHIWMVNTGSNTMWLLHRAEPTDPGAFPVTRWSM